MSLSPNSVIALFFLCLMVGFVELALSISNFSNDSCSTIYLIHVVPSGKNEELSGWNASEVDLLYHTSSLAVELINNRNDLLHGVTLDVVHVSTDDCVREPPLQDLVEIFREVSRRRCILGVVGLYCSAVTRVIADLLGHPDFGYVQLSSSTSPLFQNLTNYPYLYRFIPSSVLFNHAVLKIMDEFNWKNVSLTYDFSDIFFKTTGINFAEQVKKRENLNLNSVTTLIYEANKVLEDSFKVESRIHYLSVTHQESSAILCNAYRNNFFWPKYAYIFVDDSLEEILVSRDKCTKDQLLQAAEGSFLLLNRLNNSKNTDRKKICYDQYREYLGTLQGQDYSGMNNYANVLYDQIWTFSLAVNGSLDIIETNMFGLIEEQVKHSPIVRSILSQELRKINFQGAGSLIKFNEKQEILTIIDIYQVKNGSQVLVGEYNPFEASLNFNSHFEKVAIPEDSFEVRLDAIPIWLGAFVAICQSILLLLFLLTCMYMLIWRNAPEIKSTSIHVSILIMCGCFMVIFSSLFFNLESFTTFSTSLITVFCNIESWLFLNGISIILVALIFRLLRVFIIFHHPKANIHVLRDARLFMYIGLTSLPPAFLLVIWTAVDHLQQESKMVFLFSGSDPHYSKHFYCSSHHKGVWTGLYYSWISILLMVLLVLAIQTRHVRYNDFKDTKKMGAFMFILTFILGTLLPVSYLLQSYLPVVSYVVKSLLTFLIPLACLALQYVPKIVPILSRKELPCLSNDISLRKLGHKKTANLRLTET